MAKARHAYPFTVDMGGKTYDCRRVVTGTRVLDQLIVVEGIDSEHDGARYGPKQHPVSMMEANAKLIAIDLINKRLTKQAGS